MTTHSFDTTIDEMVRACVERFENQIEALVLFGSAARPGGLIENWSDIDVAIISAPSGVVRKQELRDLFVELKHASGFPFTVALLDHQSVITRAHRVSPFNSVILNALSGRPDCAKLIWGKVEFREPPFEAERANALVYLEQSVAQIRRLWVEPKALSNRDRLSQLMRWSSSHLRTWLRLTRTFVLPYEPTLSALRTQQTLEGLDFLAELYQRRFSWTSVSDEEARRLLDALDPVFEAIASAPMPHLAQS